MLVIDEEHAEHSWPCPWGENCSLPHSHTLTPSHLHVLTPSHPSHSYPHTFTPSHPYTLTLSHSHTHTLTHTLHPYPHTFTPSHSHTFTSLHPPLPPSLPGAPTPDGFQPEYRDHGLHLPYSMLHRCQILWVRLLWETDQITSTFAPGSCITAARECMRFVHGHTLLSTCWCSRTTRRATWVCVGWGRGKSERWREGGWVGGREREYCKCCMLYIGRMLQVLSEQMIHVIVRPLQTISFLCVHEFFVFILLTFLYSWQFMNLCWAFKIIYYCWIHNHDSSCLSGNCLFMYNEYTNRWITYNNRMKLSHMSSSSSISLQSFARVKL